MSRLPPQPGARGKAVVGFHRLYRPGLSLVLVAATLCALTGCRGGQPRDPLPAAEEAIAEERYEDAIAWLEPYLEEPGRTSAEALRARHLLDEALFQSGYQAYCAGDRVKACRLLGAVGASSPRHFEARALRGWIEHEPLLDSLFFPWSRRGRMPPYPIVHCDGAVLTVDRPDVGGVELAVVGSAGDGGVVCAVRYTRQADGARFVFPSDLVVWPGGSFPVHLLLDGRLIVDGRFVWTPPAEPVDLKLQAEEILDWSVDPTEEHLAACYLTDHGKTVYVVLCDLGTLRTYILGWYAPALTDRKHQPGLVAWLEDGSLTHESRSGEGTATGRWRGSAPDWTALDGLRPPTTPPEASPQDVRNGLTLYLSELTRRLQVVYADDPRVCVEGGPRQLYPEEEHLPGCVAYELAYLHYAEPLVATWLPPPYGASAITVEDWEASALLEIEILPAVEPGKAGTAEEILFKVLLHGRGLEPVADQRVYEQAAGFAGHVCLQMARDLQMTTNVDELLAPQPGDEPGYLDRSFSLRRTPAGDN